MGVGANGKNLKLGASAWFTWVVAQQPASGPSLTSNGQGDINIDLFDCPPSVLGGVVWHDSNRNGVQDSGEAGMANVTVELMNCAGTLLASTQAGADGSYLFSNLAPGGCQVRFVPPPAFGFTLQNVGNDAKDSDVNPATGMVECMTMGAGEYARTVSAGLYQSQQPFVVLTKTADRSSVAVGGQVVYTYTVSNPSNVVVTDLVITDDNDTPGYGADDFVVGTLASLAPGASAVFFATNTPPAGLGMILNSQLTVIGTLRTEILPGGDVKVTYMQSRGVVDNTYGANASTGYTSGHTFSDLTGGDKAQFRFANGAGQTVLDVDVDYLTSSASFPSGYGSRGVSGGNGAVNTGNASNVISATTTLSTALNQSSAFYGFTTDSPAPEASNPQWNYLNGYIVVVRASTFGASGFGGVTIPTVNNSPSKFGTSSMTPVLGNACLTNGAVVQGRAGSFAVSAFAQATICVSTNRLGAIGDRVWSDANGNGLQDGGELGLTNVTVQLRDCSGSLLRSTNTSASGSYLFTGLGAGSYKVGFMIPLGFSFTTPNAGSDSLDSDVIPATAHAFLG